MNEEREVLSADRHQLLRGHLMSEINREQIAAARPKRRRLGWVAVPALAGGLALAVVLSSGGGSQPTAPAQAQAPAPVQAQSQTPSAQPSATRPKVVPASAAQVLDQAAEVVAGKSVPKAAKGQFVYVERLVGHNEIDENGQARITGPFKRQIWLSVDGSRPGMVKENGAELGIAGEVAHPGIESPTYEYLATLPTDPDALLQKLYAETVGKRPAEERAFKAISELLPEQIAPPAVSAALYRAAAKIPGVTLVADAVDAAGRHGVAVARVSDGVRAEWIFDPVSYEYLGQRLVVVDPGTVWGDPGKVFGQTAVLKRAIVDKVGDEPKAGQAQA